MSQIAHERESCSWVPYHGLASERKEDTALPTEGLVPFVQSLMLLHLRDILGNLLLDILSAIFF